MDNTNLPILKIVTRVHIFGYLVILHPILCNLMKLPSYFSINISLSINIYINNFNINIFIIIIDNVVIIISIFLIIKNVIVLHNFIK